MLYHIHFSVVSRVVCMSLLRIYYTVSCLCCSFLYILTATMTIISLRMHCASVTAVHAYAPLSWRSLPCACSPLPCSSPPHIHCHYRVCCRGAHSPAHPLYSRVGHCPAHPLPLSCLSSPAHIYTTIMPVIVPAHPPPLSCRVCTGL